MRLSEVLRSASEGLRTCHQPNEEKEKGQLKVSERINASDKETYFKREVDPKQKESS